ncbi:MAG: MBL fold metallo-hydrolase [Crocinitomicaceae bacterium]|nr:MBL fold metallo-hydrolase [Crocinitomicaceae bacterium]
MSFKLLIVGSGSAVPTLTRAVTSQYLNFNERRILIDCGEGTQLQLRKFKVRFQRLQYIFISHLHGDHFLGIFGLLSSMNLLGRTQKLIIFVRMDWRR